jgi:hypothetical protein
VLYSAVQHIRVRKMSRTSGGFRLDLGEPWAGKLEDFSSAYYRGSKTEIIREALDLYIPTILATEPERKKRFDAAQQLRANMKGPKTETASGPSQARRGRDLASDEG